jgi:hemerythrin superfamily protein
MPNALEMLREDHHKVKQLFEDFESADQSQSKEAIVKNALRELEVHAAVEEEIFYPAAKEHVDDEESIDEAQEEHHVVRLLIGELRKMRAGDERYDAKFKVLSESVKHHIEEEESEMFPQLEGKIDAAELGAQMASRKEQLQREPRARTGRRGTKPGNRTRKKAKSMRANRAKKGRKRASGGRRR